MEMCKLSLLLHIFFQAFVEVQMFTGCILQPIDSDEELAIQIKLFTKAVAEKPSK